MNGAQWHLILNHLPVFGSMFGFLLLGWGVVRRQAEVQRAALGLLVLAAVLVIPAYLTGEPAEELVEGLPAVAHSAIEAHEDLAQVALVVTLLLGLTALAALAVPAARVRQGLLVATLIFGGLGSGLLAYVAHLGGQISHPEIRAGGSSPPAAPSVHDEHDD